MVDHSDRKGRSSACRDVKFPSSKPKKTFHFITKNVSKGQKHFSHRLFNINQCKLRYYLNHFVLESSLTKGQNLGKTKKDTLSSNQRREQTWQGMHSYEHHDHHHSYLHLSIKPEEGEHMAINEHHHHHHPLKWRFSPCHQAWGEGSSKNPNKCRANCHSLNTSQAKPVEYLCWKRSSRWFWR